METEGTRGLVEDIRMACELGVSRFFDAIRTVVRRLFLLPPKNQAEGTSRPRLTRHNTAPSPVRHLFPQAIGE